MKNAGLILVVILLGLVSVSAQTRQELKIGAISNPQDYLDGPGCSFKSSKTSSSNIYLGDGDRVWLKINGQVTAFEFVSSTGKRNQQRKKGTRYTETYRSGNITVKITKVVTSHEYNDGGEFSTATIVVTKGNLSRTVKAVGYCGM